MKPLIAIGLLTMLISPLSAKWINVAGEWDQYRLNESQRNWFKSIRSAQGVPCCDIADGHPTAMDRREDGYYIPNPRDATQPWLKVPDHALTMPRTNPIGVATVWYTIYDNKPVDDPESVYIRCFVAEAEG